jgi:ribosomal protein S18 acetylase RimI-like enzyme
MAHLRHVRTRDKEHIFELGKILFREEDEIPLLQKALLHYVPSLSYVAVDGNSIIGFTLVCTIPTNVYYAFMDHIPHGYELAFLGISPRYQGRGLGTRLLKETFSALFRASPQFTCWLLVDLVNVSAIKLYHKWGFRRWKDTPPSKTGVAGWIMGLSHRRYVPPTIEPIS